MSSQWPVHTDASSSHAADTVKITGLDMSAPLLAPPRRGGEPAEPYHIPDTGGAADRRDKAGLTLI